ncbi:MAG: CBS domain-containing protein [Rhodothermales bacterium]
MNRLTAIDVMTRNVLTAQADWPITRLAEFLIENDISGAPVTSEEGRLIGVVSLTDIVRHDSLPEKEPPAHTTPDYYRPSLERHYAPEEMVSFRIDGEAGVKVRDIMTSMIFKVGEDTPVQQVADTMIRGRIHRVFVTRGGLVVGIITALGLLDVIRAL